MKLTNEQVVDLMFDHRLRRQQVLDGWKAIVARYNYLGVNEFAKVINVDPGKATAIRDSFMTLYKELKQSQVPDQAQRPKKQVSRY